MERLSYSAHLSQKNSAINSKAKLACVAKHNLRKQMCIRDRELENQVFEKIILEEQVENYNEKFLVSGLMSASTGIKIRYIDNDKLTDDEYAVEPNLEDYYLYIEKIKM